MIENWLEIGNIHFDVTVLEISENATILYSENTGRTMSKGARMTLDPLGTFIGHKIRVKRKGDKFADYDRLFNYVIQPRYNGIHVRAVHNQTTIEYDAYISSAERTLSKIDNDGKRVYWKEMSLNIVPMEAEIIPV